MLFRSTLPYKQDQIVELNYTCNANAPLGEHAINIIYEHPSTKVDTQLDLGEHANSAKFNVISSTGITDEEASSIYAYQSGDGFVIKGLLGCEEISIYDMSGKAVLQMTATSSEEFVSENKLGSKNCIVVIKDGNKQAVIKVSLK